MIPAPLPANEEQRLKKLYELDILDTLEEQGFDDITHLAAQICDVPIALISLIDSERQFLKSHHGLDEKEISRELGFCPHAILDNGLTVVEDATKDERFHDNPLVTGGPKVKFYAGAPLIMNGDLRVGTLCVVSSEPQTLTSDQAMTLEALARQVVSQLELRQAVKHMRVANLNDQKTRAVLERSEQREKSRSEILEMLVKGSPITDILKTLAASIEDELEGGSCSILLVDREGKHLLHGAAPSLPEFYNDAIDGLEIGPSVGSCGNAAATGKRTIVADIEHHPFWEPFRELAAKAGLAACWSEPIIGGSGNILGTFAIYNGVPMSPNESDIVLIEHASKLAGVAIQSKKEEQALNQAVNDLKRSEQKMRDYSEAVSDWFWETDKDHRLSFISEAGFGEVGLDPVNAIGKTRWELVGGDSNEQKWIQHRADLESHKPFRNFHYKITDKHGKHMWASVSGRPLFDGNGDFMGYRGTAANATKDIEKNALLRKLNQVVEQSTDLAVITDIKGNIEYVNRSFLEVTGYTPEDVIGCNIKILSSGETPKEIYQDLWQTILSGKTWRGDIKDRRKDGSFFWASATINPIFDDGGNIVNFVTSHVDITDIKEAEKTLRKNEARYALVMNGLQDGVWEWDIGTDALVVSRRFLQTIGYGEEGVNFTTQTWHELVHPDDVEKRRYLLLCYIRGRTKIYSCEYRARSKSGEYIWLLERGVATRDDAGRVRCMAGSVSDVTKRRLAEDGLMHSQKMEAMGKLSAGIAHEFRNALVGVSGFSEMALMDVNDADNVQMCLDEVKKAADRASKLTNDLLAFSRNQEMTPTNLVFDVSEVLNDTGTFLKPMLGANHQLRLDVSDQPALIEADPSQLSQVVLNLCINALDAMPGDGELTVGSRLVELNGNQVADHAKAKPGYYAQIFVRDTGTGIEKAVLKRLFDPFFTTKEPGKGTGLGLSVAYGLVEEAGGFISVDSVLGEGATFMINLPLVEENTA